MCVDLFPQGDIPWHTPHFIFGQLFLDDQNNLPSNFELMMFFDTKSPEKKVGLMVLTVPFCCWRFCVIGSTNYSSTNSWFTWTKKPRKRRNIYYITINFGGSMLVFEQESFRWLKFPCLDMSWRRLKQTTTNMTLPTKTWRELPGSSFPKNETSIFQTPFHFLPRRLVG